MWKLTIEDDEQKQTSLPLTHDDYGVGRDDSNSIRLTDRNISRKHINVRKNGVGWLVRDLGSYNGTFVNGMKIDGEQPVGHGDMVQVGDYRLEFVDETHLKPPVVPDAPVVAPIHQRPDRLVVVVGPAPGAEFALAGEHFVIGRSEDAAISINHSSVSRVHAELFSLGGGRYEIIDKGSANGIRINGQEMRRGLLEAGDALELGDVRLRFVGAGKIFRMGTDRQVLPAILGVPQGGGFDPAQAKPGMPRAQVESSGGIGKMVAIGALLGVIAVGVAAFFLLRAKPTPTTTTPTTTAIAYDPGRALLEEAEKLVEKGDLEGAHKRIQDIPDRSPARDDPKVTEIEGKWADGIFEEVAKATEVGQKKTFLYRIVQTTTVDLDRRNRALKELEGIDPSDPILKQPLPTRGANPNYVAPTTTVASPTTSTNPKAGPTSTASGKELAVEAISGGKDAVRNALLARLGTGTLTEPELLLLIGTCQIPMNQSCLSRASAELKKVRAEKGR